MILIGLPFAMMVRNRKGMTLISFGIAILIGFIYYVANSVSLAFGKGGYLSPILAAWLTPLLFSIIALITIKSDFAN